MRFSSHSRSRNQCDSSFRNLTVYFVSRIPYFRFQVIYTKRQLEKGNPIFCCFFSGNRRFGGLMLFPKGCHCVEQTPMISIVKSGSLCVPLLINIIRVAFYLPITEMHFSLMIPLGKRWKSNSFPFTTTVCPALFPP